MHPSPNPNNTFGPLLAITKFSKHNTPQHTTRSCTDHPVPRLLHLVYVQAQLTTFALKFLMSRTMDVKCKIWITEYGIRITIGSMVLWRKFVLVVDIYASIMHSAGLHCRIMGPIFRWPPRVLLATTHMFRLTPTIPFAPRANEFAPIVLLLYQVGWAVCVTG